MKTKPITLRFEQEDFDLANKHSGMKFQKLMDALLVEFVSQFKEHIKVPVKPADKIMEGIVGYDEIEIGHPVKESKTDKHLPGHSIAMKELKIGIDFAKGKDQTVYAEVEKVNGEINIREIKKPKIKDLNKERTGEKAYNPNDNPAHKNDIEITIGGRGGGKTNKHKTYLETRREQKLGK